METTKVYVFGAGATAALGGPVMKDFLSEGFTRASVRFAVDGSPSESFVKVAELIDRLYDSGIVKEITEGAEGNRCIVPHLPAITIEELLAYVDLAIDRGDDWLEFPARKHALHDFIFVTIENAVLHRYGGSYRGTPAGWVKDHPNIYNHFVASRLDPNSRNCLISFNYDTLLDYALWEANPPVCADYGLPFVHVEDSWPQYKEMGRRGRQPTDVDLLKLHGSQNWARCKKCGFHLFSFAKYKESLTEKCRQCGATLSPVLVPPTLRKNIEAYGIGPLWDKAEQVLCAADQITVIGYSFPDADIEAKWLFKRAVAKGGRKPTLTISDPSTDAYNKIVAFFGNTVSGATRVLNFEEYVGMDRVNA